MEPLIIVKNELPVAKVVEDILLNSGKFNIPEKYRRKSIDELNKNDSFLWSVATNNTLSTISEISSPPNTPLGTPMSPDIYSSVFFEYTVETEERNINLACIDFILWERLSYQLVYPNLTLLRHNSISSSKTGSLKRIMKRFSRKSDRSNDSDTTGDVAVLSLPGLTSSNRAVNELGKDLKPVPLNSSLLLLSQTRKLVSDGAWYYDYLDCVSVVIGSFALKSNSSHGPFLCAAIVCYFRSSDFYIFLCTYFYIDFCVKEIKTLNNKQLSIALERNTHERG